MNFAISVEDVKKLLAQSDTVAAKPKTECRAPIVFDGRNKDNNAHITAVDWNCSGKAGALLTVPDEATKPIVLAVSTTDNGKPDRWFYDTKRKGSWDYELISSKHDGRVDYIGYDIDKNLQAARVEPYHG